MRSIKPQDAPRNKPASVTGKAILFGVVAVGLIWAVAHSWDSIKEMAEMVTR